MRDDLAWYGWFLSFAAVGLFVAWLVPGSQWWIAPIFIGVGSAIASLRVSPLPAPEGELVLSEVKPSPDPEYAERLKGTFIR